MLLLFKMNDCLRHSDRMLGTPVNTFLITARMCVDVLVSERQRLAPGMRSWLLGLWERIQLEFRIGVFNWLRWYSSANGK